ncbi:MAG: class I SAM-dependent DNA methyltransferase [Chloroflexota bacterium]
MYDGFSQDYDRFVNWSQRLEYELPFLEGFCQSLIPPEGAAAKILDAACGTGMHAIALAERGYACAGADLSTAMVQRARQNAAMRGVSVRFETAGMGEMWKVFGEGSFEAALCLGNSLPHLLTAEALRDALVDFSRLLKRKGGLVIQNRNFEAVLSQQQRAMEPQSWKDDTGEWLFLRFYDFLDNGLIQFNVITLKRSEGGAWTQSWQSAMLKPYRKAELESALIEAGFTNLQFFGGLGGEPFQAKSSGNLVIVARKGD